MNHQKLLFTVILIACRALCPTAHAVSPPPDGGYAGENTAEGTSALLHLNGGVNNTALGWASLGFNVTGNLNTGVGAGALVFNTADENTAIGAGALLSNTTAFSNTGDGAFALFRNTTGSNNTAVGNRALFSNTTGFRNNALGIQALFSHVTGSFNNAVGSLALSSDTSGAYNNAFGDEALFSNMTGIANTAVGDFVLHNNTTGQGNTAIGAGALSTNTAGDDNTAIGGNALQNNTTGSGNMALGLAAGANVTTAVDVTCINAAGDNVSHSCFIGNVFGVNSGAGAAVSINAGGQLGTTPSSRRFKEEIKPMEQASEKLYALKPVTFHYKKEIDPSRTSQFGLVAEEVEKVNPDLIVHDKEGKPYSVRYDQVNAMLLNEFLKEHHKLERLKNDFESKLAAQQQQIETLTVGLQKVSAQLETSKPAPNVVPNDP
jgi:Chaperone of endosialidase